MKLYALIWGINVFKKMIKLEICHQIFRFIIVSGICENITQKVKALVFTKRPDSSRRCAFSNRCTLQNYHWSLAFNSVISERIFVEIWIVCKSHMPFCIYFILYIIWTPSLIHYFNQSLPMCLLNKYKNYCEPGFAHLRCNIQWNGGIVCSFINNLQ